MSGLSVTGGAAGLEAHLEQLVVLARQFGSVADESLHASWTLHGYLLDARDAGSALLDPIGFAAFEARLFDALDVPGGLSWAGAQSGLLDGEVRAAAVAYRAADELSTDARDMLLGGLYAPVAVAAGLAKLASSGDPVAATQAVLAADPELADDAADLLGVPAFLTRIARDLPDGHGVPHALGTDRAPLAARAPRTLPDVLADLGHRNDDRAHHGAIDVRILALPDGSRRAIVDITGTKSWTPLPTHDITSLTTNGRALVGVRTAYEQGVLAAMHRAGVRPGDDVMLVGHSQGGLIAVNAARDADASGEFNVTHVVTAGAPIGLIAGSLPSRVQVLALENTRDLVPHLDGRGNPDRPSLTTVSGAYGGGTVGTDHSIEQSYLPLARAAQHSGNGSIRHFLATARDYFTATHVDTKAYQVVRVY